MHGKSCEKTNREKLLSMEIDASYLLALYISECFHKVLVAYHTTYNVTKSIQLVIKFVTLIQQRAHLDNEIILIASIYYSRICNHLCQDQKSNSKFISSRKIWLSCLILATKYHSEANYSLLVWSKWTGLTASELNEYERFVLEILDYNLCFNVQDFQKIKSNIYSKGTSNHLKIIDLLSKYNRSNHDIYSKMVNIQIQPPSIPHNSQKITHLTTPPTSPICNCFHASEQHDMKLIPRSNSIKSIGILTNENRHITEPATFINEKARSYYDTIVENDVYATTSNEN